MRCETMKLTGRFKSAALIAAAAAVFRYPERDPERNLPRLMRLVDRICPKDWYVPQRKAFREAIAEKNHWYRLMLRFYELDRGVRKAFFRNFILNASLKGSAVQLEASERYGCNVPWAILLDPTTTCNLRCAGCWAAEYGKDQDLEVDVIHSVIEQGKALGTYMYLYTGGEPLVRRADLLRICRLHPDCEFLSFTNGTLIDEEFCRELLQVKNLIPAISLDGFRQANDARRGSGTYHKAMHAMKLLKTYSLPFGISVCYTRENVEDVSSEAFFNMLVDCGAMFVWFFHYMPVGSDASPNLLPTSEQRVKLYRSIRAFRASKPIFSIDFQNDAEYVGGCIAGGRRYLHINANADAEPCVFIHYSNVNLREHTLLEALQSPLFLAYRNGQPFNRNMLRPCPMLENPELLRGMVAETEAKSTDLQSPETAEHLCEKCVDYAVDWKAAADELWREGKPGDCPSCSCCACGCCGERECRDNGESDQQ